MSDRSREGGSQDPGDEGLQRVRPAIRPRVRVGALPALAGLVVVVALTAAAVAFGLTRGPAAGHPSDSPTANDYELTGRLSCFGQAPGAFTPGPDLFPKDFGCPMMAVPPQGYGAATWTLDPSAAFSPNATDLHILVGERACHGYERMGGSCRTWHTAPPMWSSLWQSALSKGLRPARLARRRPTRSTSMSLSEVARCSTAGSGLPTRSPGAVSRWYRRRRRRIRAAGISRWIAARTWTPPGSSRLRPWARRSTCTAQCCPRVGL